MGVGRFTFHGLPHSKTVPASAPRLNFRLRHGGGGGVTTVTKRVVGGLTGHFEDVLGGCVGFVGEWVIREY